ncbi:MAG: phage tail-like protein [Minisyncoccia bacterium]|jgi:phage tail-like protein
MRRDDWLLHQLPVGMTEDDFLVRFVTIFQRVADTVVHQVDGVEHAFDPTVAPDNMVRLMAEWFGVDWVDSSLDVRLQREIVMRYAELIPWRGTRRGMVELLELLTRADVEVRDTGGVFAEGEAPQDPPHVRIDVQSLGWNNRKDFAQIVRDELPATVTFTVWMAGVRIWPAEDDGAAAATGHRPIAAAAKHSTTEEPNDA